MLKKNGPRRGRQTLTKGVRKKLKKLFITILHKMEVSRKNPFIQKTIIFSNNRKKKEKNEKYRY